MRTDQDRPANPVEAARGYHAAAERREQDARKTRRISMPEAKRQAGPRSGLGLTAYCDGLWPPMENSTRPKSACADGPKRWHPSKRASQSTGAKLANREELRFLPIGQIVRDTDMSRYGIEGANLAILRASNCQGDGRRSVLTCA